MQSRPEVAKNRSRFWPVSVVVGFGDSRPFLRMRVGIFSESYEPIVNGVSVCVNTLRDGLVARGHQVYLFAPCYKGHTDTYPHVVRMPAKHTWFMPDYPFPLPVAAHTQYEIFKSLQLDIVHTQTPFVLGVMGGKWARRCGIPFVSTNHTLYTEYVHYVPLRPKALTRALLVKLIKWYYSGCDAVVVPSKPVESILRSYGIKTPIRIIKTGIEYGPPIDQGERARLRNELGVGPDDPMLLYVGRIAREKNLKMLLNAFRRVSEEVHSVRLVMVGGGPALAETRRCAEVLGVGGKVDFVGMLPPDQVRPYYAAADIFVFPSTTETQGIAICEALSHGLPVVAVNAGGIPENIRDGIDGYLTADNADEFAQRIRFLILNEAARMEMGRSAKEGASIFTIEKMVSDYERFYESVLKGISAAPVPTLSS